MATARVQVWKEMMARSATDAQCQPNVISYSALMTVYCQVSSAVSRLQATLMQARGLLLAVSLHKQNCHGPASALHLRHVASHRCQPCSARTFAHSLSSCLTACCATVLSLVLAL